MNVVDILLKVQADTEQLRQTIALQREQAATQRAAQEAEKSRAAELRAANEAAFASEIKRRQLRLEAIQFERSQVAGSDSPTRGDDALRLLDQERQITNEIAQLRLRAATNLPELERLRVLQDIQRTDQSIARETAEAASTAARIRTDAAEQARQAEIAAAETERRAAAESIQNAIRHRELELSAVQHERGLVAGDDPERQAKLNQLLAQERALVAEIAQLKRQSVAGGTEAERLRVLGEIQRAEQAIASAQARANGEQRRALEQQSSALGEARKLFSLGNLAQAAAVITGVQLSMVGLFSAVREGFRDAFELGETFKNTADRLDTTAESVQVLDFAFRRGGLSITEATQAAFNLNRQLDQARGGNAKAAESFFKLGLSLEELITLPTEQRLAAFGRALVAREGEAGALDAAVDILGQKSQRTLDVLKNYGTLGFGKLKEDATNLGQLFGPELVNRLENAKQRLEDLGRRRAIFFGEVGGAAVDLFDSIFGSGVEKNAANIRITEESIRDVTRTLKELREAEAADTGDGIFNKVFTRHFRENEIKQAEADLKQLAESLEAFKKKRDELAAIAQSASTAGSPAATTPAPAPEPASAGTSIAAERAALFLQENGDKLREQNETLRQAMLTDVERLNILRKRSREQEFQTAFQLALARSDEERERIVLESENKRLNLVKDIAAVEERMAATRERAEREVLQLLERNRALRDRQLEPEERLAALRERLAALDAGQSPAPATPPAAAATPSAAPASKTAPTAAAAPAPAPAAATIPFPRAAAPTPVSIINDPRGFPIDLTRPRLANPDGSFSTERSATVQVDQLNEGRPTNIPTIVNGVQATIEEAIRDAIAQAAQGFKFPNFATIDEAEAAARERSAFIGRIRGEEPAATTEPAAPVLAQPPASDQPVTVDVTQPLPVQVVAIPPAPITPVVNPPASVAASVIAPAPITPQVNAPPPVAATVIAPAPVTPQVNAPAPVAAKVVAQPPAEPVTIDVAQPLPVQVVAIPPAPIVPVVNTPAPVVANVVAPAPITPAVNAPAPVAASVRTPAPVTPVVNAPAPVAATVLPPPPVTPETIATDPAALEAQRTALERDNQRLEIVGEIKSLEKEIAEKKKRDAADALDLEVRRRELAIERVQLERETIAARPDADSPEKQERINVLIAREKALIEDIARLKQGAIGSADEKEKLALQEDILALQRRLAALQSRPGAAAHAGESSTQEAARFRSTQEADRERTAAAQERERGNFDASRVHEKRARELDRRASGERIIDPNSNEGVALRDRLALAEFQRGAARPDQATPPDTFAPSFSNPTGVPAVPSFATPLPVTTGAGGASALEPRFESPRPVTQGQGTQPAPIRSNEEAIARQTEINAKNQAQRTSARDAANAAPKIALDDATITKLAKTITDQFAVMESV